LDTWDTSNIENMQQIFYSNTNLTGLDLSSWDTSNVTNMGNLFNSSASLQKIYVSNKFKTQKVSTSNNGMFHGATSLI
jgi:surface protein